MTTPQDLSMADEDLRQDDIVYFMSDTSTDSWAGVIDDSIDMTDEAVNDYIKDSNPMLFTKLRGMKFGSSDIPLTFKPHRDLRRLDDMEKERLTRAQPIQHSIHPDTGALDPRNASYSIAVQSRIPTRLSDTLSTTRYLDDTSEDPDQQLKLDGIGQQTIQSSAERLYPKLNRLTSVPSSYYDVNVAPAHASRYRTNSKTAHKLRALKEFEMNEALAEVSKYEKALEVAKIRLQQIQNRDPSPDASVLITRPIYMEPRKDRYKKQGLTPYDQEKHRKALRESGSSKPPADCATFSEATAQWKLAERYCYCREPDDGTELVRCSKQWCPVGWFHLRCTGLSRLPFIFEEFHCAYCADISGPLPSPDLFEEGHYSNKVPAGILVDKVAHQFRNHGISAPPVSVEQDTPRALEFPYKSRVYDDNNDVDDDFSDGSQDERDNLEAVEVNSADHTLRDKIIKWRTINGPYDEEASRPDKDRGNTMSPVDSVSIGASEMDHEYIDEEQEDFRGEDLAIPASSTIVAAYSDQSADFAGDEQSTDVEDAASGTTIIESIEKDDQPKTNSSQPLHFDPANPRFPIFNESIGSGPRYPTQRYPAPPQPSTITDSTGCAGVSSICPPTSQPSNSRTDLHPPLFDNIDSIKEPQTPTLGSRLATAKSKRPWGTPVNIRDYILEPSSPSPANKRKFSELDDENDQVAQEDTTAMWKSPDSDVEIPDSQEGGEEVPFMLDPRTP